MTNCLRHSGPRLGAVLAAVLIVAGPPGVNAQPDRPSLFGFAPAFVADSLPPFQAPRTILYTPREQQVRLTLAVDGEGSVSEVAADEGLERLAAYVEPYLRELRFMPALREGTPVASRLPIQATFMPRWKGADLRFPVGTDGAVEDRDLYFEAFEVNGYQLPRLESFPSYFAPLEWSDTARLYPYVVHKLTLDSSGEVTALDTVRATFSEATMTTASAALWADYAPARIDGRAVASECFLVVSYFPQTMYPTRRLTWPLADSLAPQERWRVQLVADTVGVMVPPTPRRAPGNHVTVASEAALAGPEVASVALAVDTAGSVLALRSYGSPAAAAAGRLISRRIYFYPARGWDGRPISFTGLALLRNADDSENIRIQYFW